MLGTKEIYMDYYLELWERIKKIPELEEVLWVEGRPLTGIPVNKLEQWAEDCRLSLSTFGGGQPVPNGMAVKWRYPSN